ncbi:hypothetical protein PM082_008479 [Marasmius tenuissimus]|nr:hypothetical protein PM082_008479 [Marasmius tenuissimus]
MQRLEWEYDWEQRKDNIAQRINRCYQHVAGTGHRMLCATFRPPNSAARHRPQGTAILDVTQLGHQLLEQILVSALILERLVTTQ